MIPWLDAEDDSTPFPDHGEALSEPDGLLAAGGSLRPLRLLQAYRQGIFPWFNPGEPVLWWSPTDRAVIYPDEFHLSRRLRRSLRQTPFEYTRNTAFKEVMINCAAPRKNCRGTWITNDMIEAYCELHRLGFAHSVECRISGELVGGVYGVQLGRVFFGESMYSRADNASKAALYQIALSPDVELIDCQLPNAHLETLGMQMIPRETFLEQLEELSVNSKPAYRVGTEKKQPSLS